MAEFVQRHLEELLPVFTNAKKFQLMTNDEVKSMIQRLRQFDYNVNKRTKRPRDYLRYGEYLTDILKLLEIRRKETGIKDKYKEIEGVIKDHAALMYRSCSHRFKNLEYYQEEITFLKFAKLHGQLSKAYTRLLQLHGNLPRVHEEAAVFEFEGNKSAENSRTIFQYAVRKFPEDVGLWLAFFKMEIEYVLFLLERRSLLTNEEGVVHDDNDIMVVLEGISDAVFEFKLVELVLREGVKLVGGKKDEFLLKCYQIAHSKGKPGLKVAEMVEELISEEQDSEAAVLINVIKNSERELSNFDLLQQGVEMKTSEKMIRMSLEICKEEIEKNGQNSSLAKLQASRNLESLHDQGLANINDYDFYFELNDGVIPEDMLTAALKKNKKDSKFWSRLVAVKVDEFLDSERKDEEKAEEIMKIFDEAISNISSTESLPIWSSLIDFSVGYFPQDEIEQVFKKAITKTNGKVCGELKSIRLKYVKKVFGEKSEEYRKEYEVLAVSPPTSVSFHLDYIDELGKGNAELKTIQKAFDFLVAEHGKESIQAWLEYGRFLLKKNPSQFQTVYNRATVNLSSNLLEEFAIQWEQMLRSDSG
ncbi:hypothetical protein FO519_001219 [Halicephalobus sp. NKZ332]|nr:hypothetical protein FO519_001219 [Halicephalobus sp. NKZ332]